MTSLTDDLPLFRNCHQNKPECYNFLKSIKIDKRYLFKTFYNISELDFS